MRPISKNQKNASLRRHRGEGRGQMVLRNQVRTLSRELEALRGIRKEYDEIVQHATEVIFKVDAAGNFFFVSSEFSRVLGYTGDQMMGRHFTSIIHPDDLELCVATFGVLTTHGKADDNIIIRVKHAGGDYKWVSCSAVCLFADDGSPTHSIGFAHDITELIRSQELLATENRRYMEVMKANARAVVDAQEKERADIGHELHDNVNQILSTAKLCLELAKTDDKQRIELISRSADNITAAVNEIRRISSSLVPASIDDLGLVPSIDDLVENVRVTRALSVVFRHEGDIEPAISPKGKLMLFRIIQEQVTNVLKHAQASELSIGLVVDRESIYLTISDNGIGFDKESVKAKKGVGLHNIANRAELFNGKIDMMTAPGEGCTLNVLIPL